MTTHDHPSEGDCLPSCPAWAEGALELGALRRRYDAMLAACRAAERIEFVYVATDVSGVDLPESVKGGEVVRLNLVVGRDCPEVLLDEWGLRATLTFRGRRHDCALPWESVKAGLLAAPPRKKARRFGVVDGGVGAEPSTEAGDPTATSTSTATATPAAAPTPTATPAPSPAPRPRVPFGVIAGGKKD